MNSSSIVTLLHSHYSSLEKLSDVLFRAADLHAGRPYAVRYFDLSNDILSVAADLHSYQERLLGTSYYARTSAPDLRWNHYVYFVIDQQPSSGELAAAKKLIEADREYSRKLVLTEQELGAALSGPLPKHDPSAPLVDAFAEWSKTLEQHDLGFVIDEGLQIPAVARHIANGESHGVRRPPAPPDLSDGERRVSQDRLRSLTIRRFRDYPVQREFCLGAVNLIVGANGAGKTSLLESIEYLFCGRVRRSERVPRPASVAGVFTTNGVTLETTSETSDSQLRARHLAWYGKADVRAVHLHESFGKFNFLDTDAAASLTVEQSEARIDADLAQLLLGAEAAKTLDRLERLTKVLADVRREREHDIQVRDQKRRDATSRLEELRSSPRDSDALFKQLSLSLASLNWKLLPAGKQDSESVIAQLQRALTSVGVLRSSAPDVPSSPTALTSLRESLTAALASARRVLQQSTELAEREGRLARIVQELEARLAATNKLIAILETGLADDIALLADKRRQHAARATVLQTAEPAARVLAASEPIHGLRVSRALKDAEDATSRAARAAHSLRDLLNASEHAQATLTTLTQQLRDLARQIVSHTGDSSHCPLCRTHFSSAALLTLLQEHGGSLGGEEAASIRERFLHAERDHQASAAILHGLRSLVAVYPLGAGSDLTVADVLADVAKDRDAMVQLQAELEGLQERMRDRERTGLTVDVLAATAIEAGWQPSDVSHALAQRSLVTLSTECNQHKKELVQIRAEQKALSEDVDSLARRAGVAGSLGERVLTAISDKLSAVQQADRAFASLASHITLDAEPALLELEAQLKTAHENALRVHTASARESAAVEATAIQERAVSDLGAEIQVLRAQVARVERAERVISVLLQKQSSVAMTNQVLRDNAAEIGEIFSKIHAPNEFDVLIDEDRLAVTRRSTRTQVELHEMSSGQRAAFTLSLFLAMNRRLGGGPTVMLFDDPVAHVDDINALSFFDYLRELALKGDRQIFFATADSKLAGLFFRKFRFLGDEFRQIDLTR